LSPDFIDELPVCCANLSRKLSLLQNHLIYQTGFQSGFTILSIPVYYILASLLHSDRKGLDLPSPKPGKTPRGSGIIERPRLLEKLAQQARVLSPRDARTEDLWRRAANLYQGEFLPSIEAEWVESRRESLHQLYIEALLGLAECARARSDFRQALDTYKRASELEPYREDIHQAIMICYADKGDKQRIVSHLNELKKTLRRDLHAEPSQKTLDLAKSLLG
jgi:tetratricopeptide (TPR) repeat protein